VKESCRFLKWVFAGVVGLALVSAGLHGAEAAKLPPPGTNTVAAAGSPEAAEAALLELFRQKGDITNTLGMVMVWLPDGYRVGKYEVTQEAYEQLTGANPSKSVAPQQPVERVSWTEAAEFCQRLTDQERKEGKLPKGYEYALPTEKQWEFYVDNASLKDAIVSLVGDRRQPMNVGLLPPNDYGLHDVRGNVWEWCSAPVARGAGFRNHEDFLDVAFRYAGTPDLKFDDIGFRCILNSAEPPVPAEPPK
jgi:formylglycine-generating enzyme required for sulfatase activity